MISLRLPSGKFRLKNTEKGQAIFDSVRKKFVHLTPEEWVRQHVIYLLLSRKQIPAHLINVEKQLQVAQTIKRYDILTFNPDGSVYLIVECKAPHIPIDQGVFDQIARYNLAVQAQYLMVTNGLEHYFCTMDYANESYQFIQDIPNYKL